MDLQESSTNKWRSRAIQSHVSHKGMWKNNKSLLWRNICIGCKMEHHQNNECFNMIKDLEGTSFGCDNGISKWMFSWWSLHAIVTRIWLPGSEHLVCRLFRALHGLKQTPFNGFKKLIVFWRYKSSSNGNMYYIHQNQKMVILLLYINNMFITRMTLTMSLCWKRSWKPNLTWCH